MGLPNLQECRMLVILPYVRLPYCLCCSTNLSPISLSITPSLIPRLHTEIFQDTPPLYVFLSSNTYHFSCSSLLLILGQQKKSHQRPLPIHLLQPIIRIHEPNAIPFNI